MLHKFRHMSKERMPSSMNSSLALLLAFGALIGLGKSPAQASTGLDETRFQKTASMNDERFKVFLELEAKANAGDAASIQNLGRHYFYGLYPVKRDKAKSEALWIQGACLGSDECATFLAESVGRSTDSEAVIERTKWQIVGKLIRQAKSGASDISINRPDGVSEGSFEEARKRAEVFFSKVSIKVNPPKGRGNGKVFVR